MTVLLVDGDQYLYKACAAVEREIRWDEQNHVLSCNEVEAWDLFRGSLSKLKEDLKATTLYLAFSGSGNFRKDIYPLYKAHRTRKPLCYGLLRARAYDFYTCKDVPGLEADDLLGIWATGSFKEGIIVSDDKDMLTLPATLYRGEEVFTVTEGWANYHWLKQTLTGDTSDGYPGCPGIGPVKAEKLLNEFGDDGVAMCFGDAWLAVVRQFEAAGLTEEDALIQAQLARILRSEDWDTEKKEVRLWQP